MFPAPFVVIVDANLLYPFTLRDTVLRAAAAGFFQLRWSKEILDEVERNLVENGAMPADKAGRLRAKMEDNFPEAEVTGYELLTSAMPNEEKDRHVVAAAVKAGAQVIATENVKHFTPLPEGIEAQSADEFLCNLFDLHPGGFVEMLREQASDLKDPPMAFEELLERLARVVPGLVDGIRALVPPTSCISPPPSSCAPGVDLPEP
jgi:predicted nucleic acid-binding protein